MNMKNNYRTAPYWRNLALFTLACFAVVFVVGGLILAHQRAMILVHPAQIPVTQTPMDWGIQDWENVSFQTDDGLMLKGWFISPDFSADGATLIYVHGLGANRQGPMATAEILIDQGYGALIFDLRNHGESEGEITTLGYEEVKDIAAALDYLHNRPDVNPQRIGVFGQSMGAGTVIRAAARNPEIRVVIAESGFTSLRDNINYGVKSLLGLPPVPFAPLVVWFGELEAGLNLDLVRPIDDIAQISPRPVLLIHGKKDQTIPFENSVALYSAAEEPKELYLIPEGGHGGFLRVDPDEYQQQLIQFLATHLGPE